MGTRGLIGFRVDGIDKLAYNHYDSYPSQLGHATLHFFRQAEHDKLAQVAKRLRLVDDDKKPTAKQRPTVEKHLGKGAADKGDWYRVLNATQGKWQPWYEGMPYCLDNAGFIFSNGCKWVYLYNVESSTLEIYSDSSMTEARGLGRYNHYDSDGDLGARLLMTLPLEVIHELSDMQIETACTLLDELDGARYAESLPKTMSRDSILKCVAAESEWSKLEHEMEIKFSVLDHFVSAQIRMPNSQITVDIGVGDGFRLTHPGYGEALQGLLNEEFVAYAVAIYGDKATISHYRKIMAVRSQLRQFPIDASYMPMLTAALDDECRCFKFKRVPVTYFEQLKSRLHENGLQNGGWKFLMRQGRDVLVELFDMAPLRDSHIETFCKIVTLMTEGIQREEVFAERIEAGYEMVRKICGWGSWDSRSGMYDNASLAQKANAAIAVRALMRANMCVDDVEALKHDCRSVSDYVRSLDSCLPTLSWGRLLERTHKWHQERLIAKYEKENSYWETRLSVYAVGEYLAVELGSAKSLAEEAFHMKHCVDGYVDGCVAGTSRIFSIRKNGERVATLEIQPTSEACEWKVVQMATLFNVRVSDPVLLKAAKQIASAYGHAAKQALSNDTSQLSLF